MAKNRRRQRLSLSGWDVVIEFTVLVVGGIVTALIVTLMVR
jgi:hypothetical protein